MEIAKKIHRAMVKEGRKNERMVEKALKKKMYTQLKRVRQRINLKKAKNL